MRVPAAPQTKRAKPKARSHNRRRLSNAGTARRTPTPTSTCRSSLVSFYCVIPSAIGLSQSRFNPQVAAVNSPGRSQSRPRARHRTNHSGGWLSAFFFLFICPPTCSETFTLALFGGVCIIVTLCFTLLRLPLIASESVFGAALRQRNGTKNLSG